MDYADLIASAVAGGAFGAIASIGTARRVATSSERARSAEEARQRLLAKIRAYRATCSGRTGLLARNRQPVGENPFALEVGMRFTEQIELDLPFVPPRLAKALRQHLANLVGSSHAAIARDVAYLPMDERHHEWRADAFLRIKGQVPSDEILGGSLIGRANVYEPPISAGAAVVEELRLMEATVLAGRPWFRRRHLNAVRPKQLR